jgi:hypothetical protein
MVMAAKYRFTVTADKVAKAFDRPAMKELTADSRVGRIAAVHVTDN